MPKIVDREQRRRELAGALLRLIARDGIEAVSVRAVAAEAGVSAGAVQKYFDTKEELLRFGFELTGELLTQRWDEVQGSGNYPSLLRQYVRSALPLDQQRRAELVILFAFTARAATRGDWGVRLRRDYADAHTLTTQFLEAGQDAGQVRDDLPAAQLADVVLALTDGFSARLLHHRPRSAAHRALLESLDLALDQLLSPERPAPS